MESTPRQFKPYQGFVILNAYGEPWSPKVFERTGDAARYMTAFWGDMPMPPSMESHSVIPVLISPLPTPRKASRRPKTVRQLRAEILNSLEPKPRKASKQPKKR